MTPPYVKNLRRMLLLLPALAKASLRGETVKIERAIELTGSRSEAELRAGIAALEELWTAPDEGDGALPVTLYEEDGELTLAYPEPFGTHTAFSLAEAAVLLAALEPLEKDGPKPVKDALRKLRRAIPELLRDEADALSRGLDLAVAAPEPWAGVLAEAIAKRVETVLEYRAVADAAVEPRTVEPRLLFQRDGQWYLAAWNVAKGEEHLYRLDRIASVVLGTRVFGEHQGPPTSRFSKNLFFQSGRERDVTVRYTGLSALHARKRKGARQEPDGDVTVTVHTTPGNYLFGDLLALGGEAAVAAPPDAAQAFEERLEALERLYR